MFGFGTYLVGGVFEPDVWEALAVGDWELAKQRGRERKREKERERERERGRVHHDRWNARGHGD
jgi:hypothetical protein